MDSDTDNDNDSLRPSQPQWDGFISQREEIVFETTTKAIQYISDITSKEPDPKHLVDAISTILAYINRLLGAKFPLSEALLHIHDTLELVHDSFIDKLFTLRQRARSHAAGAHDLHLYWPDVLLSQIWDLIVVLAQCSRVSSAAVSLSIDNYQKEDRLRAITQLPTLWSSVATFLAAESTSPLARRCGLALLFGTMILWPKLAGKVASMQDCCSLATVQWPGFDQILRKLIDATRTPNSSDDNLLNTNQQLNQWDHMEIACLLVIYAETQMSIKSSRIGQSALRCFTNSVIGHHVQSILTTQHKEKDNSTHDLPPAQNILVVWGRFIPWCWACAEEVGRNTVMSLTALWLYRNSPHLAVGEVSEIREANEEPNSPEIFDLKDQILINPQDSHAALLAVVQSIVRQGSGSSPAFCAHYLPPPLSVTLFHSCEFLLLSLQEIVTRPAADASRQTATVGVQALANVILYIGWRGLELRIRELIVMYTAIASSGWPELNAQLSTNTELFTNVVISLRSILDEIRSSGEEAQPGAVNGIKSLVDYLTILRCHSSSTLPKDLPATYHKLCLLLHDLRASDSVGPLLNSAILLTGCLDLNERAFGSNAVILEAGYDSLFRTLLLTPVRDMCLSGSVAHLVLRRPALFAEECLLLIEMTDYLQCALLLLLNETMESPKSLLAVNILSICRALKFLGNQGAGRGFQTINPWFRSLKKCLADTEVNMSISEAQRHVLRDLYEIDRAKNREESSPLSTEWSRVGFVRRGVQHYLIVEGAVDRTDLP